MSRYRQRRQPHAAGDPREPGFTLVEVVVSLAILSLILLATVSALRTFANTQKSLDRVSGRMDEVRSVSRFLRESLEAAVTGETGSGGLTLGASESQPAYFRASAESAEWKSAMSFGERYGGVFIVRVAREGDDLVLRWREPITLVRRTGWEEAPSKVLVSGVQHFEVAVRPEFGLDWEDEWVRQVPPAVVRFRIRARDRFWPELIVQVQR